VEHTILIIKLGALGDFIQALGPIQAIRNHHKSQKLILLTTAPFKALAIESNLVDEIILDRRPSSFNLFGILSLRKQLKIKQFSRVYDLQTSQRSSLYFNLFWPKPYPEWSGIALKCSHPHNNALRNQMHTVDRQREQLQIAGIKTIKNSDLSWAFSDISKFGLPNQYALLIPGGSISRPAKHWPAKNFGAIAKLLKENQITPVIIGTKIEKNIALSILEIESLSIDLTGETSLIEVIAIAKRAKLAIGNDTGPMHICATVNCNSFIMFSNSSNPQLCAPRGKSVKLFCKKTLLDLTVSEVSASVLSAIK